MLILPLIGTGRHGVIDLNRTESCDVEVVILAYEGSMHCYLKKNQTTPRPSEHPPVMGEKMSKRLGEIKRLQIQNLFMAFKQVPRCR